MRHLLYLQQRLVKQRDSFDDTAAHESSNALMKAQMRALLGLSTWASSPAPTVGARCPAHSHCGAFCPEMLEQSFSYHWDREHVAALVAGEPSTYLAVARLTVAWAAGAVQAAMRFLGGCPSGWVSAHGLQINAEHRWGSADVCRPGSIYTVCIDLVSAGLTGCGRRQRTLSAPATLAMPRRVAV